MESEENDHSDGDEEADYCEGNGCGTTVEELYFCSACEYTFCTACWIVQAAHRPSSTRRATLRPKLKHEKIKLSTLKLVQPAFSTARDERELEQMMAEDAEAAWFGVARDQSQSKPLFFHDYGRFAELMAATSTPRAYSRQSTAGRDSPTLPASPAVALRRTPSLVSFVGQSGAGKSTLIKLLILFKSIPGIGSLEFPVAGNPGGEVPTSENVHLYLDPSSSLSDTPVLYADCEGLDGGERAPVATEHRSRRQTTAPADDSSDEEDEYPSQNRSSSKRKLEWAQSKKERTRNFAVSNLYPRILFPFSDIVIFVHRNPRVIESVLEQLITWAASAVAATNNQPILPYAIIVLNASPNDIDPRLWDIEFATRSLFDSMSKIVTQNDVFDKYVKAWQKRGRKVETVEELMNCYYSSVKVIRLPRDTELNRMLEQAQSLYREIDLACQSARQRKSELRMLLDAEEFQSYLSDAFDLYSQSLAEPFDFVRASFLHRPIPDNFGGNILKLAIAMKDEGRGQTPKAIFNKLGNLVGSCIMLDAVRHNVPGSASHIFPQYLEYLDEALEDFCDRSWPCEYYERFELIGAQYDTSSNQLLSIMNRQVITYQCVNSRAAHNSKGHQNSEGIAFGHGQYHSNFSFENACEDFRASVYYKLKGLLDQLTEGNREGERQSAAAVGIHRKELQDFFHKASAKSQALIRESHTVCWCCLFETSQYALSCGHVICTTCLKSYGRFESRTIVRIHECPFESYGRCQPRSIYIRPETAGIRMLVLDDGGARATIQLEILRFLEQELGGKIPVQLLFDMIVGKGSGGVVALGLINRHWTLADCTANVCRVFKQAFSSKNRRKISRFKQSTAKYRYKALEQAFRLAFTENQELLETGIDGRVGDIPRVLIPVTSSTGKSMIFSNYVRRGDGSVPPPTSTSEGARVGIKSWEAARAAMARPSLFKPFKQSPSNQFYTSEQQNNPLKTAVSDFENLKSSSTSLNLDTIVSLGTGLGIGTPASPAASETRTQSWTAAKRSVTGKGKQRPYERFDQECERTWNEWIQALPGSTPKDNYTRLNIDAYDLAALDDMEKAEGLRSMVGTQIRQKKFRVLASRLLARLLYFEKISEVVALDNELFLRGEILCRIPDGTPALGELGRLLRDGKFRTSKIILQEYHGERQLFDIPQSTLEDMIHDLQFHMPEINIRVSQRTADFDARLLFANREEYSISGFPRSIVRKKTQTAHTRDSMSSSTIIRHRPRWTPPDLRSSISPSFDSGIQLSSRPKSVSSSLKPTTATGSQSLLPVQELPAPDPRPTNAIQELPAQDTRDPRAIQQAMVLERERDRIRKEERELLEDRLKTLEATQKELTSALAGLQSPSSVSSGHRESGFDFGVDGPLINLRDSLNPSPAGTVKVEGWKVEFEVDGEGKFEGNGRQYVASPTIASPKADRFLGRDSEGYAEGSGSGSRRHYED